ncbi:hypothetical protein OSC27_13010 [Microbacterium sp. STN6]|uniref:hypothetical protein n=1 Tax=Microbacterium sp. STN6 TaxID=2995588 RepID=UPI002260964E|nr:hypothetical protein [Microbacterium sp. STN6]MCX7523191.1 hypothetical protein [Microbacterium sp. STN6]
MSNARTNDRLILGAEPRVHLLPPEVLAQRHARGVRRALGLGVVGVLVIIVAATGAATLVANEAQSQLEAERDTTVQLLSQQSKLSDVRTVQQQVSLVQAAQQVGASTEIDWKAYLEKVQATLPANVTITSVTVDSASPLAQYSQPTAPLQGARVATLSFAATSPTLPQVPAWLTGLSSLTGFADATPGSVALDPATGTYTVDITMHINDAAFDKRFVTKEK